MTESKIQSKPSRKPYDCSSLEQNKKFEVDVVAIKRIRNDVDNSTKSEAQSGHANASSASLICVQKSTSSCVLLLFLSVHFISIIHLLNIFIIHFRRRRREEAKTSCQRATHYSLFARNKSAAKAVSCILTTLSQAWSGNCIRGPQCAFEMSMFMCPAVHKLTRN